MTSGNVATFENMEAIEALYQRWRQDPAAVDESWRWFFQGLELGTARSPAVTDSRQTSVVRLIYAYREIGHFLAHLDPLNEPRGSHPLLELSEFGLSDADLDRTFDTTPYIG